MLSHKQKAELSILAAEAYNRILAADLPPGKSPSVALAKEGLSLEKFRHQEVAQACGKWGLTCASSTDYNAIKAHFLHLLGRDDRAFHHHQRAATEPRRIAEWKIMQLLQQHKKHITYAETACRRTYKCTLGEADEKTLWKLYYNLQRYLTGRPNTYRQKARPHSSHQSHDAIQLPNHIPAYANN